MLVNGCRQATLDDFLELADRRTSVINWQAYAENLSAMLIQQGVIDTPLNSERAKEFARIHREDSRTIVASESFPSDALEQCVVIVGDDTAAYVEALPPGDLGKMCGIVAPPFEWFWIECRSPNRFSVHSWGVLFHGTTVPPDQAQDGERWLLRASLVFETTKNDPWGPVATYAIPVSPAGHLWPGDEHGKGSVFGRMSSCIGDDDEDFHTWQDELPTYLFSALLSVSFMHCKNVDIIDIEPPPALSKRHIRRHGRPLVRYKTLDIDPMRRVLQTDGHADAVGLRPAFHICRGHFKTFHPDAPLFGRITGTYWWTDHVRGDSTVATVHKDYRIRIAEKGLGRPYEPAHEHPESYAVAESRGSEPDVSGRGLAAHSRTQNDLARAIGTAGFAPRGPKPEEPQYDLAWETPDSVWVAEVKSLTATNEMRQMHTAIGQVIDYAHRLDDVRPVRMMIAVERRPGSDHWSDECAKQGIVLCWPDGFEMAVRS